MAFRLVQGLLEAHGLEPVPADRHGDALLPRVDQVLLGSEQAALVVALLERAGVESVRVHPSLADPGRAAAAAEAEPASDWQRAALDLGMLLPRPGHGEAEVLHREWLAAPGRLALCAGPLPGCGAFGMLALEADAMEVAAVLAGGPMTLRAPRVRGVALAGALPRGVGGVDLALALLSRLREAGVELDALEFGGPGVAGMSMADRMGAAWLLAQAGIPAVFPADDATRAELAALGRDQDWRCLEGTEDGAGGRLDIDLGEMEPLLASVEEIAGARPARGFGTAGIERVLVGPAATFADLTRLASRLEGCRVLERVECTVVAGSRALLDCAMVAGVVERLTLAGVRVVEGPASAHAVGAGMGLCFGVPFEVVTAGRARWLVGGVECCAAAALGERVERPGSAEAGEVVSLVPQRGFEAEPWRSGGAVPPAAPGSVRRATGPVSATRRGRARGEVLAVLGDEVENAELLAPGARIEGLRSRLRALADELLSGADPGFAQRARERGGGFLVAGSGFARGAPGAAVALCLAELSVRGVLARSFARGMAQTLVHAGVLPLGIDAGAAPGRLERGDELELPGMPESLVPGRPLTARNLTRGTHLTLAHDLSARDIAILRAGGLLSFVVGHARGAGSV